MSRVLALFTILTAFCALSQTEFDTYKEKYPNSNGVFLNKKEAVVITLDKEGQPDITAQVDQERIFLNDNYKFYTEDDVSFSSFNDINSINAYVYVPKGEKYKKSKITDYIVEDASSGNVFHDDLKKMRFYYSGLVKGGKTSLSYEEKLHEPHFFGSFYFSSYLPVEKSEYVITAPADMEISYNVFGSEKEKVEYSVVTKGNTKIHTWKTKDLEELDYQSGSVAYSYFATHIQVRIGSYKYKGESKYVLRNVDDLYEYYRGFVNDVNLEMSDELKAIADSLTRNLTTNDEKVKAIFYWVQDQIKYVAFEAGMGGFVPREADLVCDRKYGDCKDMASVLYAMINSVGIPAYYTWIGTRDIPYSYSVVPTPAVDNHMICAYYNGKEYIFLDATGKGVPFGMPTSFIQGKEALVGISEKEYKLVEVPVLSYDKNQTIDSVRFHIENGVINGTGTVRYTGYAAFFLREYLVNIGQEDKKDFYKNSFKKGNNKCKSRVTKEYGLEDRDADLVMDYTFELPDYVRENNGEIYLNPFLKKYFSDSKINLETTSLDIENTYNEINRNVTVIEIPEGYVIEYIPENMEFSNDNFTSKVDFSVDKVKNEITVTTTFIMDHLILNADQFEEWNKMIKKLNNTYTELIILKKG